MTDADHDIMRDDDAVKPDLKNLLNQLATDSRDFARAEVAWVKAEAGNRVSIAIPGLILTVAAIALLFALIIAGLLGAMFALSPLIGLGWAVVATILAGAFFALVLAKLGSARLARAFSLEKEQ